VFSSGN
jgi:hypothetical protein